MLSIIKKYKWFLFIVTVLSTIILSLFYSALKPKKTLPIYNPSMVNPELVDSTVQYISKYHSIANFSFTNQNGADLLISLHVDHYSNPSARGVATFFYGSDQHGVHSIVGERFASLVQREICARTDLLNCRTHAKTWDVLRLTQAPAVRVDLGYLTNEGDAARLARPDFRDTLAEAFIIAIQRLYLSAEDDAKTGTLRLSDLRSAGIRR